ncbi:MAG: glycosyltransferase family 20-domain-containing protein [Benjaminiella poitrasii]|nr:MAG: glycosyltransferase family 20-domain-containing protein [Benjaminiella poitrasii]
MLKPSISLTAETVAHYLPLSGNSPDIQGRIINVTHQIPYNILRSQPSIIRGDQFPISPPRSPRHSNKPDQIVIPETTTSSSSVLSSTMAEDCTTADPVAAAPISKLARHHKRGVTLRMRFHAADWTVVERRGHQALYAGLQRLRKDYETIHIGWSGPIRKQGSRNSTIAPDKLALEDKVKLKSLLWETGQIVPIFLDKKSHGHYEGYCKQVLWPVFHYLVQNSSQSSRLEKQYWDDYVAVNRIFADTIIERYQANDIIFINDYHLLLVPDMIREKLPDAAIGLFIHATFPSSEIFRCLQTRNEILQGMLGANLVGFQTYSYARHFISSCTRVLGCETTQVGVNHNGTMISVGAFPIGVDCNRIMNQFCKQPGVQLKLAAIRDMYAGKKIIVGRDKLDSTKGILQKLHAFERFLTNYPEWRQQVVLIQVATPTYGDNTKLESKISELVNHINSEFGTIHQIPVHYYYQDIDRDEYYALLTVADLGLITPCRDGMNTTSYEYVLCQHEKTEHGPLILSEFVGSAGSLGAALLVNPYDYGDIAKNIHYALTMSTEEKNTRHEKLYNHVTSHTADFWAHSFIKQLVSVSEQQDLQSHATPKLDTQKLVQDYQTAKKRVMFFDYDGTLTPIVSVPSDAKPGPDMLKALQTLCNDPKNIVWVVSGRDQTVLDEWLGCNVNRIGLSAEHGCYIKEADSSEWNSIVDGIDMSWKTDVEEIFDYYTERTQGSFVEHKKSSITWHYRLADSEYGAFQAKECQNHLENAIVSKYPVEILVGKKNLEVRPMMVNKGEIVKRILSKNSDANLVICAGDDKTDEDMFRALSAAHYQQKQQAVGIESSIWPEQGIVSADISSSIYPYIYTNLNNWPCVRLLNASGTIGCHSINKKGGILYQTTTQQDILDFIAKERSGDHVIVMPFSLLTRSNIDLLVATNKVNGLVIFLKDSNSDSQQQRSSLTSPDSSCPNCQFGLYANDTEQYEWNPDSQNLIEQSFDFPIFAIRPGDNTSQQVYDYITKSLSYNIERRYEEYPLKAIDFELFMWAAVNSETCLRRKWCQAVGGMSVFSSPSLDIQHEDSKPIIVVSANIDSRSIFHDLTIGASSSVSGLVTVLAIAEALSRAPVAMDSLPKHVLYTLFAAESWAFAGSQRFVNDISTPFICTNATRAITCPYTNAPCTFPCVRNLHFKRINFEKIESIFEFQSVSGINDNSSYFAHVDDHQVNQPLISALMKNSRIKLASGDGVQRRLPPSSAMSFLQKKRDIKAVVISDYQKKLGRYIIIVTLW